MAKTLLLLRHGQSSSNAAGKFTGWTDVSLTAAGEREAVRAGNLLLTARLLPDVVHTSVLRRAIRTAEITLGLLGRDWLPTHRSWRLNERQYGALSSSQKAAIRAAVGEEQFRLWRRSFRHRPPPMSERDVQALRDDPRYCALPFGTVPTSESLADVLARVLPYWTDTIVPDLRAGRLPLVIAHGNSLRALVMHLDSLNEDEVAQLNIPTGIPLCYTLDENLRPLRRGGRYLDPDAAWKASAIVAKEGT